MILFWFNPFSAAGERAQERAFGRYRDAHAAIIAVYNHDEARIHQALAIIHGDEFLRPRYAADIRDYDFGGIFRGFLRNRVAPESLFSMDFDDIFAPDFEVAMMGGGIVIFGDNLPDLEIFANILTHILNEEVYTPIPVWQNFVIIVTFLLLAMAMGEAFGSRPLLIFIPIMGLGYIFAVLFFLEQGWVLPILEPLMVLGFILLYYCAILIFDKIISNRPIPVIMRDVAVLVIGLNEVDFESYYDKLDKIVKIIGDNGGAVENIRADSVLAVFSGDLADPAANASRAAHTMLLDDPTMPIVFSFGAALSARQPQNPGEPSIIGEPINAAARRFL